MMNRLQTKAESAGFVLSKDNNGFYHLYDTKMKYDVLVSKNKEDVERVITDELAMIEYNKKNRALQ
jgi:hypothetical protein